MKALIAGLSVVILAACGGTAAPATPQASAGISPAASPQSFDVLVQAAKAEGKISIMSTQGEDLKTVLADGFEQKYGISVDYLPLGGGPAVTRVLQERAAGKYLWDVVIGGTATAVVGLAPSGALDPLDPVLMLPEVKDPANYLENKLWYANPAHSDIVLGMLTRASWLANSSVNTDQFTSYKDLLNPQWNGKIVTGADPRVPGPTQDPFDLMYHTASLGQDFIKALVSNGLVVVADHQQALNAVAQGKYSLLLGPDEAIAQDMARKGVAIKAVTPQQIKEGGSITPGPASLSIMNKPPHSNAAKLYVNWVLSKEAQTSFAKITNIPSLRADVPLDPGIPSWRKPVPGYMGFYTEEQLAELKPVAAYMNEVLPK